MLLAFLGMGGRGFGITGHLPFVRADFRAKMGGSLYLIFFRFGGCGTEFFLGSGLTPAFRGKVLPYSPPVASFEVTVRGEGELLV